MPRIPESLDANACPPTLDAAPPKLRLPQALRVQTSDGLTVRPPIGGSYLRSCQPVQGRPYLQSPTCSMKNARAGLLTRACGLFGFCTSLKRVRGASAPQTPAERSAKRARCFHVDYWMKAMLQGKSSCVVGVSRTTPSLAPVSPSHGNAGNGFLRSAIGDSRTNGFQVNDT